MHAEARPSQPSVGATPALILGLGTVTVLVAKQFAAREAPWVLIGVGLALIACLGRALSLESKASERGGLVGLAAGIFAALLAFDGAGESLRQVCAGVVCILGLLLG